MSENRRGRVKLMKNMRNDEVSVRAYNCDDDDERVRW
jgi:hypothetical protein